MTSNEDTVTCFLTGKSISIKDAVRVTLHFGSDGEEEMQTLFAARDRFKALVHSSIPLHPALTDAD